MPCKQHTKHCTPLGKVPLDYTKKYQSKSLCPSFVAAPQHSEGPREEAFQNRIFQTSQQIFQSNREGRVLQLTTTTTDVPSKNGKDMHLTHTPIVHH